MPEETEIEEVTWEEKPLRIAMIRWTCGCEVNAIDPGLSSFCAEHVAGADMRVGR